MSASVIFDGSGLHRPFWVAIAAMRVYSGAVRNRLLFTLFFMSLALDLALAWPSLDWRVLPAALVGWFAADLVSGLVHMYMDYRPCRPASGLKDLYFWEGSRDSPEFMARQDEVYGQISLFERIVYDFKKHHPFPDLLGRHSFLHLMKGPTFLLVLPASLTLNLVFLAFRPPAWLLVGVVVLLTGAAMTQAFHGALHRDDVGLCLRMLRGARLVMSRRAHKLHHDTLTQDFAVINGWSNPLVNLCATTLLRMRVLQSDGLEPT
jgi:hypothetical protein